MGRSGGGGGGRSGGGGGSRSRSSGGGRSHSSSGRSSYRSSSSSRSYSSSHHHHHHYHGGGYYHGGGLSFGAVVAILFLILCIGVCLADSFGSMSVTKSTVVREKIETGASNNEGYLYDDAGWIGNKTKFERGMKYFYDKTGVIPFVCIIDNIDGDYDVSEKELEQYAIAMYDELIDDEGHFLLALWDHGGEWMYWTAMGAQVGTVMDQEACDILFDYIDKYYYEAATEEEFFSLAFEKAADRIMQAPTNFWDFAKKAAIPVSLVILAIVGFSFWKRKVKRDKEKAEETERILKATMSNMVDAASTPTPSTDNLLDKYK